MKSLKLVGFVLYLFVFNQNLLANSNSQKEPQYVGRDVGRDVARKYFENTTQRDRVVPSGDHYLAIHFGRHLGAEVWSWSEADRNPQELAQSSMGVTYRLSEWNQIADKNLRLDFNEFHILNDRYYKLSFLPMVTFPDAASEFPLYFGIGVGLGVFFRQTPGESSLSLDNQLVAGARFLNVYNSVGFFLEGGLKNHLLLLSDGQLNATFASLGTVFTF